MRLDKYLVEQGYYESRNRALEAIKSGEVMIDEKPTKASQKVNDNTNIQVKSSKFYVSRAAKKLESFLEAYPLSLSGKTALDIGSSTGGFAQILLERGVVSLDCVDVGRDQLHHTLKTHPKLALHEETDIRTFESEKKFTLITCDVSFISILQIAEDIDRLATEGCDIIILYKPQFEVGREVKRDSRGVIKDTGAIDSKRNEFISSIKKLDWYCKYEVPSILLGKEGNQEYIYYLTKK